MFSPLPTPFEINIWDRKTIEEIGLSGEILMENASREATRTLSELFETLDDKKIIILCGPGNNGGDGFAMARQLMDSGANVLVFHTHPKKNYKGATGHNLRLALKLGIKIKCISDTSMPDLNDADIIVDALLGTGFEGSLRPKFLKLVRNINKVSKHSFIFSVDIPSGMNGKTGEVLTNAVKADATVTFEAPKVGLLQSGAENYTGRLIVCKIGIPSKIKSDYPPQQFSITEKILSEIPVPTSNMHKGSSGHLLIIGGSSGLTGALQLAGLGALRAGTGLVTMACPSGLVHELKPWMPELMTKGLGNGQDWDDSAAEELLSIIKDYKAIVIGPGLGRSENAMSFVEKFINHVDFPCVYDADALYAIAKRSHVLPDIAENSIFTPHPGEMATLLSSNIESIQKDRIETARKFATSKKVFLVLKGAGTVIGCPDSNIMMCPISAPNLATGGSGDILAGIMGSLLARGLSPMQSSCIGVYWHARSGLFLKDEFPYRGNLSTETANSLPKVLKEVLC